MLRAPVRDVRRTPAPRREDPAFTLDRHCPTCHGATVVPAMDAEGEWILVPCPECVHSDAPGG